MNLQNYVKELGISIIELSRSCGVSYSTLLGIVSGKADIRECRVKTLIKIADSLNVNPVDILNNALAVPPKYNYINAQISVDESELPKAIKNTISELEEFDRNRDPMFFECADMLYMMADRFLQSGSINRETHDKLILKYPIA